MSRGPEAIYLLLQGVPTQVVRERIPLDDLDSDHLPFVVGMLDANGESPRAALERLALSLPNGAAIAQAALRYTPHNGTAAPGASPTPRFPLLSVEDLANRPRPHWLADGHLQAGDISVLFGPSGSGKSFIGLDLALAVASGEDWLGVISVERGDVVYIAAEGSAGLTKRIAAWQAEHPGADLARIRFMPEAVNLADAIQVQLFLEELQPFSARPALIIFDTLARCMVGGDENSARDMGLLIAGAERIKTETGAHIQLVHHTGKNGESERGSSALRGAVGTMLKVSSDDELIKLECEKQKDAAPFDRWRLKLTPTEDGESCTVQVVGAIARNEAPTVAHLDILAVLESHFDEDGASATQWLKVSKASEPTFFRARKVLAARGYVSKGGLRSPYRLTEAGREALAARGKPITVNSLSGNFHDSELGARESYHSHPPLLRGESDSKRPAGGETAPDRLPWQGGDDGGGAL